MPLILSMILKGKRKCYLKFIKQNFSLLLYVKNFSIHKNNFIHSYFMRDNLQMRAKKSKGNPILN